MGRVTVETQDARRIASTFDACGRRTERAIGTAPGWTGTGGRLPAFTGLTQADIQAGRILTPPQTEPPQVRPPDTVTRYAYDARGQLTTLSLGVEGTGPAADRLRLTHDALGRETSRENGRGFALYQRHDAVGQLVQQRVTARAETAHGRITGYDRHYRYDRAHAPVEISDDLWGTTSYQYDPNGQVTEARHGPDRRTTAGLTQPGVLGTAERYDQFGLEQETAEVERFRNDLAKDIVASDTATARTNPAPLTPWLTSPGGRVHAARGPAGERILLTHDVCGRVVVRRIEQDGFRAKVWTYCWDAFDRMTGCTNPDGETWRYQYDPFGRRVEKRCLSGARRTQAVLGTRFVWDGDLVAEALPITRGGAVEAAAGVTWHFEPGTFRPMAREAVGTGVHYVVNDHLGTPRELSATTGELDWSSRQRLWGEVSDRWRERRHPSRQVANCIDGRFDGADELDDVCPFRFQGQWADAENELCYNRFRLYDPALAQYYSPDPVGLVGGLRPQGYVENPTTFIDPFGLDKIHAGRQAKHDRAGRAYIPGRSYLNGSTDPQALLDGVRDGTYPQIGTGQRGVPIYDFGKPIGSDGRSGLETQYGAVHSSGTGSHVVPVLRNNKGSS